MVLTFGLNLLVSINVPQDPDSDPDIDSDVPPLKFIVLTVDGEKGENTWFLWKVSFAGDGEEVGDKIDDGVFMGIDDIEEEQFSSVPVKWNILKIL